MRILVTRPQPDADQTAELLRARGHDAIVCPLMEIVPSSAPENLNAQEFQAILITSANGVRAFAQATPARDMRMFTVGAASAEAARKEGFTHVESAEGDVGTLAALVGQSLDPVAGKLLHVAGSVTAGDLSGILGSYGFEIEKMTLYQAKTADILPVIAKNSLQRQEFDAVVLFSPRTARIFTDLVGQAGLAEYLGNITALCLSPAVAGGLNSEDFLDVRVSYTPDHPGILEVIDAHP